jgi:hypothetical protein
MNIKELKLLKKVRERRNFKARRKAQMEAIGQDIKPNIDGLNPIQYEPIGDYEKGIDAGKFSAIYPIVNFEYMDETPVRIRSLEIKRKNQPLTQAEEKELAFYYRTRNKFKLAQDAEDNRNARLAVSEVGKYLRAWI